jgi:alpha-L-fucosidase
MEQNSEGIYGSSPWKITNELLSDISKDSENEKSDTNNTVKDAENDATSKLIFPEVVFTTKHGYLYGYVCSAAESNVLIKSLALEKQLKITNIKRLGTEQNVKWTQTTEGLKIEMLVYSENEIPVTGFKIELN